MSACPPIAGQKRTCPWIRVGPRRDSCAAANGVAIRSPANAADASFGEDARGCGQGPEGRPVDLLEQPPARSRTPPSQIVTRTRCSSIPSADTLRNPAGSTRVTWRAVPPHPSIRTAAPFSICMASVDRRSATTSRLNGSPISTSGAPAWTNASLSWVPHSCRRRPSSLADARTDGKAKEPRARRASDGLLERLGLA
jgi:hypothetical protein